MRPTVLLAVLLLAAPALAGCVRGGEIVAVVSAPKEGGGLTILVAAVGGLDQAGTAYYKILKDGKVVYPLYTAGDALDVAGGEGSKFVPYSTFVVGNGKYEVEIVYDGASRTVPVLVDKWVEYVFLHPIAKGQQVWVDVQLSRAQGGLPSDRIIAEGELTLDIFYRGLDGSRSERVRQVSTTTPGDETFSRVIIPKSQLDRGPGYYSFEGTFDNYQAYNNNRVGNDPAMKNRNPPWNWVCIDTCA